MCDRIFSEGEFSVPERNEVLSPEYFEMFRDDSITNKFVVKTNVFGVPVTDASISTTAKQIEQFLQNILLKIRKSSKIEKKNKCKKRRYLLYCQKLVFGGETGH